MEKEKECDRWRLLIAVATRIYRWLANAPRWFYRLGLGWLFGHRMVQITHRGRKSGVLRRTVLEVLHYDPQTREVLVVSGWEGKTDWYRNIEHEASAGSAHWPGPLPARPGVPLARKKRPS